MTTKEIIKLGITLGLRFNKETNYPASLKEGRVIFDGCNGQRFLFESEWDEDRILRVMGQSLINLGKRQKCLEISQVLSINED